MLNPRRKSDRLKPTGGTGPGPGSVPSNPSQPRPGSADPTLATPTDDSPVRSPSSGGTLHPDPSTPESPARPESLGGTVEEKAKRPSDTAPPSRLAKTKRNDGATSLGQSTASEPASIRVLKGIIKEFEKTPTSFAIKRLFGDENIALQSRKDDMGDVAYQDAKRRLKQELLTVGKLASYSRTALRLRPLEKRRILDLLLSTSRSEDFITDAQEVMLEYAIEDMDDSWSAVEMIIFYGTDGLSLSEKQRLIARIIAGSTTLDPDAGAALGTLYLSAGLAPDFTRHDHEIRTRVLTRLKTELMDECRRWPTLSLDQRLEALKRVRDIQCAEMGIGHQSPEILPVKDLGWSTPNGWVPCSGLFIPRENVIRMNTSYPGWDDFDEVIDTLVHENTHNYQKWLVSQLYADQPMDESDPRHLQATLFALNQGHGYLILDEAHLDKDLANQIYKSQPKERHAFLAGGEAKVAFRADAKKEAQSVLGQVREALVQSPGDSKLELLDKMLSHAIANQNLSSTRIYGIVDTALKSLT
ncbi:hypothetical protein [Streptosporangium sp. NBC_01469]|uniref:hypothetical protein n=1 Tax=Streptosporangium sp. NBC_01469 TaxID=2903898 RepID=UPI002E2953F8|nr:hypothetical protein [Streptosporangium sp. NBC_01469]